MFVWCYAITYTDAARATPLSSVVVCLFCHQWNYIMCSFWKWSDRNVEWQGSGCTVGFHNFNLRSFNLRVSNPNKLIVGVFLTRCQISICQGLGPKKHDEISEIDRMDVWVCVCVCSRSDLGQPSLLLIINTITMMIIIIIIIIIIVLLTLLYYYIIIIIIIIIILSILLINTIIIIIITIIIVATVIII